MHGGLCVLGSLLTIPSVHSLHKRNKLESTTSCFTLKLTLNPPHSLIPDGSAIRLQVPEAVCILFHSLPIINVDCGVLDLNAISFVLSDNNYTIPIVINGSELGVVALEYSKGCQFSDEEQKRVGKGYFVEPTARQDSDITISAYLSGGQGMAPMYWSGKVFPSVRRDRVPMPSTGREDDDRKVLKVNQVNRKCALIVGVPGGVGLDLRIRWVAITEKPAFRENEAFAERQRDTDIPHQSPCCSLRMACGMVPHSWTNLLVKYLHSARESRVSTVHNNVLDKNDKNREWEHGPLVRDKNGSGGNRPPTQQRGWWLREEERQGRKGEADTSRLKCWQSKSWGQALLEFCRLANCKRSLVETLRSAGLGVARHRVRKAMLEADRGLQPDCMEMSLRNWLGMEIFSSSHPSTISSLHYLPVMPKKALPWDNDEALQAMQERVQVVLTLPSGDGISLFSSRSIHTRNRHPTDFPFSRAPSAQFLSAVSVRDHLLCHQQQQYHAMLSDYHDTPYWARRGGGLNETSKKGGHNVNAGSFRHRNKSTPRLEPFVVRPSDSLFITQPEESGHNLKTSEQHILTCRGRAPNKAAFFRNNVDRPGSDLLIKRVLNWLADIKEPPPGQHKSGGDGPQIRGIIRKEDQKAGE
ncbi:uncharacterized protein BDR25DRAFT_360105 [Lindgomyces ingoldianus]|uniref:Uncharacterized protein n=1 Tax=Lindgomyces ingoldianus TaxID=673940 RepID=A0ACB6QHY0_9PLEO|nr:uncharacterized protein BDR25DRAFT_360105 [Lindgomyces ingoldianus]KAF2465942.1 hypothetical protein BDR25DRAFT_360105 [Lindgomyces ingoldianus]